MDLTITATSTSGPATTNGTVRHLAVVPTHKPQGWGVLDGDVLRSSKEAQHMAKGTSMKKEQKKPKKKR